MSYDGCDIPDDPPSRRPHKFEGPGQPLDHAYAPPESHTSASGYGESTLRAFSFLQTQKAELGAAIVVMEHVNPVLFGDAKTVAMRVLGG